jgi:hypothetical protein
MPRSLRLKPGVFDMFEGTTILAIRHGGKVVVVGDGQVSLGQTVMKHGARKVRKLHHDKSSPALPVRRPTRSRCLKSSKPNLNNLTAT